jgi:hypothetical protein
MVPDRSTQLPRWLVMPMAAISAAFFGQVASITWQLP